MTCSVAGCSRPVLARGWCGPHYKWSRRNDWAEPQPDRGPQVGDPSGHGTFGAMERQWTGAMCHECGGWYESVGAHVYMVHEMTAAEYREVHGLPRTQPLTSLSRSAELSEHARAQVGTAGWQRLVAARDPVAASQARDDALRRSRPAVRATREAESPGRLPERRPLQGRICPACGTAYVGSQRTSCGDPACVSALRAEAARRKNAARYRPLTDAEEDELRAIGAGDVAGLEQVVRRLYRQRVPASAIAQVLGRGGAWMTKHFPQS